MATLSKRGLESKDYGGIEVWTVDDPDSPIYLAPHLVKANVQDGRLTAAGILLVDSVLAMRRLARGVGQVDLYFDMVAAEKATVTASPVYVKRDQQKALLSPTDYSKLTEVQVRTICTSLEAPK